MPTYKSFTELYDGFRSLPPVNTCNCTGPTRGESKCRCQVRQDAEERLIEKPEKLGRSGG